MRKEIEEINTIFNPHGGRKPFDVFIDYVINNYLGVLMFKRYESRIPEYAHLIKCQDKNKLSDSEKDQIFGLIVRSRASDIQAIKDKTTESVATMLRGTTQEAIETIMKMTLEDWFDMPDLAHVLKEFILETLSEEIAKMK